MKKISLFMLMIFGMFMLFATDAAPEAAQENAAAAETAAEQAQPAENTAEPVETLPETSPEPAQPAEAPAQEEQKPAEPETPAETETPQEPAQTAETQETAEPETVNEPHPYVNVYTKPEKVKYYRPYLGAGVPLIVIGSVSFMIMMPAMGTMAFAASDACEGKDWDFCEELHENNKKHHGAWTAGSVLTGVLGAGMIAVGSWLTSIEKPKNMPVEVSGFSILPSNKGMFASLGLKF